MSISKSKPTTIHRQEGVTSHERYLNYLCEKTFLSLWSYPGVYRDQKDNPNATVGKEVCDLLVVFDDHVIIFSDKACAFPNTDNLDLDWSRWFKKAIFKSAQQIWGAERWIKAHPERLFLDPPCQQAFPFSIPDPNNAKFHRIVVAHGCTDRCINTFDGSGSLMIMPRIVGDMHYKKPFTVGQLDTSKGFVHVFDDITLDIVLKTLDTISDFVSYLEKKEEFIASGKMLYAAGEEELLAFYLQDLNKEGVHDFVIPKDASVVAIDEGFWDNFIDSPQRQAQLKEDEISYAWDALIETFNKNIINGTLYYTTHPGFDNQEILISLLAREPRFGRRMLAKTLLDLIDRSKLNKRAARIVMPPSAKDVYYVFVLFPPQKDITEEDYRKARRQLFADYCMVTKLVSPRANHIIGIATEPGTGTERSEDLVYLDASTWDEDQNNEAKQIQDKLNLFKQLRPTYYHEDEYPNDINQSPQQPAIKKVKNPRNKPCPCGSGKKYKRCCGR